jgi:hypothetical protein
MAAGVSKDQARKVRQPVLVGDLHITGTLDGTTTTEIVELSSIAEKVTVQSSGDLAGNITVSINGKDFNTGVAFVANTLVTYSTNLVRVIKVTRTGGSGKLSIVAR